jgi:trk system potassium uptake protein TrkA
LAVNLEREGHGVTVVERDRLAMERLPEAFAGRTVLGTGIDDEILRRAGVETADALIAVTNYDNTNVVAAQMAKEKYKVKRVLARVFDPKMQEIYQEFGLETICPTLITVRLIEDALIRAPGAAGGPGATGGPGAAGAGAPGASASGKGA